MGLFKVALLVVLLLQVASLGVNAAKAVESKKLAVSEAKPAPEGPKGPAGKSEVKGVNGKSSVPEKAKDSEKKSEALPKAEGSKVPGAPEGPKKSVVADGDNGPAKKSVIPDAPVNGGGKKITTKTEKTVNGTKTTEVEREPIGKHMENVKTTITEVTPEETIVTVIKEVYTNGRLLTTEMSFSKSKNTNVTRNETQTVITSSKSGSKSATAISSSIPAVLISSGPTAIPKGAHANGIDGKMAPKTVEGATTSANSRKTASIVIGAVSAIVLVVILVGGVLLYRRRRSLRSGPMGEGDNDMNHSVPLTSYLAHPVAIPIDNINKESCQSPALMPRYSDLSDDHGGNKSHRSDEL